MKEWIEKITEVVQTYDLNIIKDFIQSHIDQAVARERERLITEVERFIKPAESSRGQGGIPLYGTVKDWEIHLTKQGWETIKRLIREDGKEQNGTKRQN